MGGPTSGWLVGTVALLLAAELAWAVGRLPRHRTGPLRDTLRQALALLLAIALSLVLVGLALNRSNGWFETWSDLVPTSAGTSTSTPDPMPRFSPVRPDPLATGHPTQLQAHPADNPALPGYDPGATGGQYLETTLTGSATGISEPALVWLPASYASQPDRFYPVLLAFSGSPGGPSAYRDRLDIGSTLATLDASGVLRDTIVVVPKTFPGTSDGECVDGTTGPHPLPWETYVDTEVRAWTVTNLRVLPSPDAWATVGYSAGGFCAAMLALRHPDHYHRVLVLSGYFAPDWSTGRQYRPTGDTTYDLATVAERDRPDVALWAYSARDDHASMQALTTFAPAVHPPTTLTVATQETGGHRWVVWQQGLPAGLAWLAATAPAFAWTAP